MRRRRRSGKRLFDLAMAAAGLIVLAPLFGVIGAAIRRDDGGPVFFRQERIGRDGVPFRLWKFRSMRVGAEQVGRQITVRGDARVTRVGRLLRKTKLDELPQLINVVKGEMSLVGPRPEVGRYVGLYTAEQRRVMQLVPGITDPASLAFIDEEEVLSRYRCPDPDRAYCEEIMPKKLALNLEYGEKATLFSDVAVIIRTLVGLTVKDRKRRPPPEGPLGQGVGGGSEQREGSGEP